MAATADTRALPLTRNELFFEHDPGLDDSIKYCWGRPSPVNFRPSIFGPREAEVFEIISPERRVHASRSLDKVWAVEPCENQSNP